MRKFYKILLLLILPLTFGFAVNAQKGNFWKGTSEASAPNIFSKLKRPSAYKLFQLNENNFNSLVHSAPLIQNVNANRSTVIVSIPCANGEVKEFRISEFSVMEPGLAVKYPELKQYTGVSLDGSATVKIAAAPFNVSATIYYPAAPTEYIDQVDDATNTYIVVSRKDILADQPHFNCTTPAPAMLNHRAPDDPVSNVGADDSKLRSYRLALVTSGEYSQFYLNGTETTDAQRRAKVMIAVVRQMVRVNGVFERDFGLHMNLVTNNDLLFYLDAATDPFNNTQSNWNANTQSTCTSIIGEANYDIGHLFDAQSGGGNAGCIGCVCSNGQKGSGYTGYTDLASEEWFLIDYATHEIGHQFGGNHTFSYQNEGTVAQVEPGSGSSIMGYAGITGATDVQPHSDDVFHAITIQQVTQNIKTGTGSSCAVVTNTGNNVPVVAALTDYTIPKSTPFMLTGSATDADAADVLSYTWEQMNQRATGFSTIPSATATAGPQFRAYSRVLIPTRTFPVLSSILNGTNNNQWEVLPSVARTLNFRFTARDNHVGGPANQAGNMIVTVSGTTGPFLVTLPNTAATDWPNGSAQTVTWSVNGTTGAPINCANVKISLSTDGGQTFPIVLAANSPNDGTEDIVVSGGPSTTARVKVESIGNIFFDISNANFTLSGPASPTFNFNSVAYEKWSPDIS